MTIKQSILKFIYPLVQKLSGINDKDSGTSINTGNVSATVPFYSLHGTLANKSAFDFNTLKGKKVMVVNLASNCGFTGQYEELEKLRRMHQSDLVILGFPANYFKGQEPGSDEEIESFCRINYGVSFPIFTKASVIKSGQQEVFEWLSNKDKNGWNGHQPSWNFCKYLLNENGELVATFKSHVSPLDNEVLQMIEQPVSSGYNQQRVINKVNQLPPC